MTRKTTLLTLIFLLALAIAIPAASALSITAPGTYTLSGDQTTLTITGTTGTTGTYTINGAGYSVTGSTTITAPGGSTLTINLNDITLGSITSTSGDGADGANGTFGGSGGSGGSVSLSLTNSTAATITLGDGGTGGSGGDGSGSGTSGTGGTGGSISLSLTNSTATTITLGNGGSGGSGGSGGTFGGSGGSGGSISITITNSTAATISLGNGGDGADGGNGRFGGTGGTGGSVSITITGSPLHSLPTHGTSGSGGSGGTGTAAGGDGGNGKIGGYSGSIYNNIIYSNGPLTTTNIPLYTTPTPGTNIVGGSTIAGNYWTNTDGTGYSDQSVLGLDISPTPYGGDQYPLLSPHLSQPTNTPDTISTQTPDITTSATDTYKINQQYNLPTPLTGITYLTAKTAVIATGNAIYQITETAAAQPVTTTADTTITQTYLSTQTAAAITTNNTVLIYPYTSGTSPAIAIYKSQTAPLAVSQTSQTTAYITATGNQNTLYLHNTTTGQNLGGTSTTDTHLSANNNTNLILGHSGTRTLSIYQWTGTQIQKTTQQIPSPITKITEIPGTNAIIVTTTAKTYTYTLTQTGTATLTTTSTETTPLQNTRGTNALTYISTNNYNNLYIIDQSGTTIGTYTAGAQLNGVDIARLTGLSAIAGGADTQLYFLSKSGTSDWYLQQTSQILDTITNTAMATTGYYALVAANTKLYLYSQSGEIIDDTAVYWLNGIVINTNGAPYVGQITFGDNTLTTDQTGKFMVLVTPGTTYTITAGTTTTQYTATNVQYQTIAIKIQPDPYATNVDYSAQWNSTTQAIDMTYTDQTGRTNSVTWKIRNTATNDIVYQQTTTSGQTLSYPLPAEQQYTNYQVSMTADRTSTSGTQTGVSNTWMITPSGSSPITLPLDDTGKNILFTGALMVFAALFGVMYSTKGAFAITALAAMMRYLELITIPWIVIVVAMAISILAALAKGSGGR